MLQVDIILLLLTAAALVCSVVLGIPKSFRDAPHDVLICAAHSDDCVIMGAEYAYGTVQKGLSVRIVYLTSSGPQPEAEIGRTRRAEALMAWSAFGVPRENITFVNLNESQVGGPVNYTEQDIERATEIFRPLVCSLPRNAAVIIPAKGESHIDHCTVRKISLQALVQSKREDLLVYEVPEYNVFLSLLRCPKRAIWTVLRYVPPMGRFIGPYAGPSNFVAGRPGFVFRDTPNRLAKKRELLRYFTSQDPDLLVRLFGHKTPYRRLASLVDRHEPESAFCVSAFGRCCDLSVVTLGLAILISAFLTAREVARAVTIALSPTLPLSYLPLLGGFLTIVYVVRWARKAASIETSLFSWAIGLGLISSAFEC